MKWTRLHSDGGMKPVKRVIVRGNDHAGRLRVKRGTDEKINKSITLLSACLGFDS